MILLLNSYGALCNGCLYWRCSRSCGSVCRNASRHCCEGWGTSVGICLLMQLLDRDWGCSVVRSEITTVLRDIYLWRTLEAIDAPMGCILLWDRCFVFPYGDHRDLVGLSRAPWQCQGRLLKPVYIQILGNSRHGNHMTSQATRSSLWPLKLSISVSAVWAFCLFVCF